MWRELTIISKIQNNKPIGFFDSGVGGLTVLSAFRKVLPNEDCIFFGDTKNMPYGEKSKEQLLKFSNSVFEFFERQEVKAVVMACNTTSAIVYEELKDKYNFVLYPLIQSVSKVFADYDIDNIGVFATPATVNSHAYSKYINKFNSKIIINEIACPSWVQIVEDKIENSDFAYEEVKLKMEEMLSAEPEKIILGCTHYPYLINQLSKFAPEKMFINPADIYANFIKSDLTAKNLLNSKQNKGFDKFFVSSNPEKFVKSAAMFYDVKSCQLI